MNDAAQTLLVLGHPVTLIPRRSSPVPFKVCGCCRHSYATEGDWQTVPMCGVQDFPEDNIRLELRNCPCGSTIAIEKELSSCASNV
jgi:hypothetical protein